jgi:nicotinate-nucleotide adenylyltransferase
MTVIATASNPRFSVSRVDVDRGGPTYTIDTLTDLGRQRPGTELFFITGADALAQIVGWRDNERLFDMAHFVGVTRPGYQLADADLPAGGVSLVEVPALAISSTDCRDRVRRGSPVWYLVPDGVVQYIEKRGLYRAPRSAAADGEELPGAGERRPFTTVSGPAPLHPIAGVDDPAGDPPPSHHDPSPGDTPSHDLQEIPR